MNQYTTLFEQQSYQDALDCYQQSLSDAAVPVWDDVLLTASSDAQAKGYEEQLRCRRARRQLPERTRFAVIPDRDGLRVGSGGATFSCLRHLAGQGARAESGSPFAGRKVLVIHSGGDSKRVPQYSVCGKLFSPVPRLLPDHRRSTLFDEFMIGMSTVAGRIAEGMLVCSGDVLLLFNALQIDFYNADAAALSIKESVETGKDHGVYLRDDEGCVSRFLHKQSVEALAARGAVDGRGHVDIDTGVVILSAPVLDSLYSLVDSDEKYRAFVNEKARLSFLRTSCIRWPLIRRWRNTTGKSPRATTPTSCAPAARPCGGRSTLIACA
ncbi:MAG: L-fucokinase [Eubacteriales bacterium]|nr:L-fucokinase [Eubacteriales bacterium]